MVEVSLKELLKSGRFGPLELGMHQDQVFHLLGEPDDTDTRVRRGRDSLLLYGSFELYFDEEADFRLSTIYVDNFRELRGGKAVALDPWVLRGYVAREEVESNLICAGIEFRPVESPDTRTEMIRTQSGVELSFWRDGLDDWPSGLCSITHHTSRAPTVVTRQIGIRVPIDAYERLRQEAMRRRRSIEQICSEWVIEQAVRLPED